MQYQMDWMPRLLAVTMCMTLLGVLRAGAQDGILIEADRVYGDGQRIASPWAGLSFVVPSKLQARYDPTLGAVVMRSADVMAAVFGVSEATPEELGSMAIELLEEQGISLSATRHDRPDERTIRGTYPTLTSDGLGVTVAAARGGPHDNVVAVFALGPRGREQALNGTVEAILNSIEWSEPEARGWPSHVGGRRFRTTGTSSTYSPGGADGYGSHASGTQAALDLCDDGAYVYRSRTESYFSIEGASAERISEDEHAGHWRLVAELGGAAYIVLEATDGRTFIWPVKKTQEGALVDGTAYTIIPEAPCP